MVGLLLFVIQLLKITKMAQRIKEDNFIHKVKDVYNEGGFKANKKKPSSGLSRRPTTTTTTRELFHQTVVPSQQASVILPLHLQRLS